MLQKRLAWALFVLLFLCVISQLGWFGFFFVSNYPILPPPLPLFYVSWLAQRRGCCFFNLLLNQLSQTLHNPADPWGLVTTPEKRVGKFYKNDPSSWLVYDVFAFCIYLTRVRMKWISPKPMSVLWRWDNDILYYSILHALLHFQLLLINDSWEEGCVNPSMIPWTSCFWPSQLYRFYLEQDANSNCENPR